MLYSVDFNSLNTSGFSMTLPSGPPPCSTLGQARESTAARGYYALKKALVMLHVFGAVCCSTNLRLAVCVLQCGHYRVQLFVSSRFFLLKSTNMRLLWYERDEDELLRKILSNLHR